MEIIEAIDIYFGKEKLGSITLLLLSACGIILSGYFWWQQKSVLFQGAIPPLLVIGIIAGIVGGTIFFRTDSQVEALKRTYHEQAQTFVVEETSRMSKVNRNWAIYKWIELAIILISLVGLLFFSRYDYWLGCSIAALFMASFLLSFDVISERNGQWYAAQINKLSLQLAIVVKG